MKAIVVSHNREEFNRFIHKYNLNKRDYLSVKNLDGLYGYKDVLILLTGAWYLVLDEQFINYLKKHNIDTIEV